MGAIKGLFSKLTLAKVFSSREPSVAETRGNADVAENCGVCGHDWGPDYVWLAALMQVSPVQGACSASKDPHTRCGCEMRGHFTFADW